MKIIWGWGVRGCLEGSKTWQAASRGIYTCWGRNWKSLVQFTQKTRCEINICWKSSLNLDTSLMKMLSNSGGHTACGLTADLGFQHLNPRSFHSCPALSSFSTSPANVSVGTSCYLYSDTIPWSEQSDCILILRLQQVGSTFSPVNSGPLFLGT